MQITLEGMDSALATLDNVDNGIRAGMRRALHRIGGEWKKTAVAYAPISPSSGMIKKFARQLRKGGEFADRMYVVGRRGESGIVVRLTAFYMFRMSALEKFAKNKTAAARPMPGGLMRSITMRSTDSMVEVFVPSNSPAGAYAFKIHEEKGKTWKDRGPGTQAKGLLADDKFIARAAADRAGDFATIVRDQIDKAIERSSK